MEGQAADFDFILGLAFFILLAGVAAVIIYTICWAGSAAQHWVSHAWKVRRARRAQQRRRNSLS